MSGRRLFAVICPNGLGHFRRVVEVLRELSRLDPDLRLEAACGRWQRERMAGWDALDELESRVNWIHGLLEPGVRWSLDPGEYDDGRLLSWTRRLESAEGLHKADLVLSDNLSGVLQARPDAVLMGSFLWSDVLEEGYPASAPVVGFAAAERALLERCRPPMLCVGAIAMPGVLARTRAVPLAWMRSAEGRPALPVPRPERRSPKIAVLIGATGAADALAKRAAEALLDRGASVALPESLYAPLSGRAGVSPFRFDKADFLDCDIALCRPGLGSIHDCIYYGLPMALIQEGGNRELEHNGSRVQALGLGIDLGPAPAPEAIAEKVIALARSSESAAIRSRLRGTPLGGITQAAGWLKARLSRPA